MAVAEPPAIVRYGIVSAEVAHILQEAEARAMSPTATPKDKQRYVDIARDAVRGNYPLFHYLVLERDPNIPFWEHLESMKSYQLQLVEASRGLGKTDFYTIGEAVHDIAFASISDAAYVDLINLSIFETEVKAQERLNGVKSIFEHAPPTSLLRAMFGDVKSRASQWNEDGISFPSPTYRIQPNVRFIGAGSAVVGAHPHKLRGDDLVSPVNSNSKKKREKLWQWWTLSINPVIKSFTNVRLVYTPYWEDDIHGRIKASKTFRLLKIPCLNDVPIRGVDYRADVDENDTIRIEMLPHGYERLRSVWPCPLGEINCTGTQQHFQEVGYHRPLRELCSISFRDTVSFLSQMMLKLQSEQGTRVKPEMVRFWVPRGDRRAGGVAKWHMHMDEDERPKIVEFPEVSEVSISAHCYDHAIGKKSANDQTSMCAAYRTKKNDVFFAWRRGRWGFNEAVKKMESFYTTDILIAVGGRAPRYVGSEAISFQAAYSEQVGEKSQKIPLGSICQMKGNCCESIGLHGLGGTADKDALLVDCGILNHAMLGKIFLPLDDEYGVNQVFSFTPAQDQAHDDEVDSMRGAYNLVKVRKALPPMAFRG